MVKATPKRKSLPKGLDWLPSGNIRVRVLDASGVQATVGTYADEKTALLAHAAALTDIARGDWIDPSLGKITFADLAEKVRRHREHDLAPSTQQENAYLLRSLLPTFGTRPVNKISVHQVDVWWAKHADHPVRRRNAYFLLSNVFRYGMRWAYMKTSPCQVENAGADVSKPRPVHTVDEFEAVVRHLEPKLQRALRVLFGAHLRIRELCGLNWSDWDAKAKLLRVERQADRQDAQNTRVTKTRFIKTIQPLRMGVEALQEQQKHRGGIGALPIFHGPSGGRLRAVYINKYWRAACAAEGIEDFHVHDVRHVSLTQFGKESLAVIMARDGHRTARAALRYQAATREADEAATRAVDEALAPRG